MTELTFSEQLQQFVANHTIMVFAWVALLLVVLYTTFKSLTTKVKTVDNAQATQLINKSDAVVIDLRSDDEYRTGHIVNSVHLVPSDIKTQQIKNIEKYKDHPLILADLAGLTAGSAANGLVKLGFSQVYTLKEGINGWRAANLPLVKKR